MDQRGQINEVYVEVRPLPGRPPFPLPDYATSGAAGMDLVSVETVVINPRQRVLVGTGLAIALPEGFEGQVRPRSGLALKHGITVLNAPGTIDADYRGEVKIILINLGDSAITLNAGERVAQLVVAPVRQVTIKVVTELSETLRGDGGFGHTGR